MPMNSRRSPDAMMSPAEGYDRWAAEYDDQDPTTLLDEPFVQAYCRPRAGMRVLDIGCGTGRYVQLVSEPDVCTVAMDLSLGMLMRARRRTLPLGRVLWIRGDSLRLPIADAAFHYVVSGLVVDHVDDLAGFFAEIGRVLTADGIAVVSGIHPSMQRMTGSDVRFTSSGEVYTIPGAMHDISAMLSAASAAGLDVLECSEPKITPALVARRPDWQSRLGVPALILLALRKSS